MAVGKQKSTGDFYYKVIRSDRKSYGLKVNDDAELIVKAPWYAGDRDIEKIVNEKQNWIKEKIRLMKQRASEKHIRDFKENTLLYYLGEEYRLRIDKSMSKTIEVNPPNIVIASDISQNAQKNLEIWYKHKAKKLFTAIADDICIKHGLAYKLLKLNNPQKRWGSCSSSGNINLCWRLIMAPERIIHYVIAHEIAHTVHLNHSNDFWQLTERLHPSSKQDDKWLDENGHKLHWD